MEESLSEYLNKAKREMNVIGDGIRKVIPMACEYSVESDFRLFPI